jgi:hypothetical protein
MPSRQELGRMLPTELAVFCQRVADNPGAYLAAAADEASNLNLEWAMLESQRNPNYALQQKIEQQKVHLGRRMVEFLADNL